MLLYTNLFEPKATSSFPFGYLSYLLRCWQSETATILNNEGHAKEGELLIDNSTQELLDYSVQAQHLQTV